MKSYFDFESDELVDFDDGHISGRGKVVGYKTPAPGRDMKDGWYLVEVTDGSFPNESYPFKVVSMNQRYLTPAHESLPRIKTDIPMPEVKPPKDSSGKHLYWPG